MQQTMATMDEEIESELYPDEEVIWRGRPGRLFILRGADIGAFVGMLIALSLMPGALAQTGSAIVAIPMILICIFNMGRIPHAAWLRSRTRYVLTNERVLIFTDGFDMSVKSMPLLVLTDISLSGRRDGRGTIVFEGVGTGSLATTIRSRGEPAPKPSFEMISDARSVYDLIIEARRQA